MTGRHPFWIRGGRSVLAAVVCAATLSLVPFARVAAQATVGAAEALALREAESLLNAGDLAGAESLLRSILDEHPTSVGALLELEKVLRMTGDLEGLVEPVRGMMRADPGSSLGHQMLIRTYAILGWDDEVGHAAAAWIATSPRNEMPYREVARVWESRGETVRAVETLEEGRRQMGRPGALALELGDLYARLGDRDRAVQEWSLAMGEDGRGLILVRRRLAALPDGGAGVIPPLVDRLIASPTNVGRLRAAVDLAIGAGLEDRAVELAMRVASELRGGDAHTFLLEMARRGDGARLPRLAYWAYSELVDSGRARDQQMTMRARLAELALAVGDTARARENFTALERGTEPGSAERRQATAMRIRLTAQEGRLEAAIPEVERFRREFPEAAELDELIAAVAGVALKLGRLEEAAGLVAGARGPRTSLVKGQLALRRGELPEARAAFMAAAGALRGEEATRALAKATLLGRLSRHGGELLGLATEALARRATEEALAMLVEGSASLRPVERTALLDFAAGLAERHELPLRAEEIRRLLVTEYPEAPETPAALLALGRSLSAHPETVGEAQELLERLLLEYPRSALVPQARRELERWRRRM